MGYIHKRYGRRRALSGLGDLASDLSVASNVASDPYFPEVVCRIQQLTAINNHQVPGACVATPAGIPGGAGLANAVVPLRAYVFAQENKWVYPMAIIAILGIPFYLGYEMGGG